MTQQLDIFADAAQFVTDSRKSAAVELTASDQETLEKAFRILERTLSKPGAALNSPELVADYLKLHHAGREREVFTVLFLDNQNRVIATEDLFHGTIDMAAVYPREVVKAALKHNAAALILSHNHPSGVAEPSQADQRITEQIKEAAKLVEVRVLDHFIIGRLTHYNFANHGLL